MLLIGIRVVDAIWKIGISGYTLFEQILLVYMHHDLEDLIRTAIMTKKIIELSYHYHIRIAEPHLFGIHEGRKRLPAYQIVGQTTSCKFLG